MTVEVDPHRQRVGATDYERYRGRCFEVASGMVTVNHELTLVRGHYIGVWGAEQHWWCKTKDGTIIDETRYQFPCKGAGIYEEFDGYAECESCGKRCHEDDATIVGSHFYCSGECYMRDVGF